MRHSGFNRSLFGLYQRTLCLGHGMYPSYRHQRALLLCLGLGSGSRDKRRASHKQGMFNPSSGEPGREEPFSILAPPPVCDVRTPFSKIHLRRSSTRSTHRSLCKNFGGQLFSCQRSDSTPTNELATRLSTCKMSSRLTDGDVSRSLCASMIYGSRGSLSGRMNSAFESESGSDD